MVSLDLANRMLEARNFPSVTCAGSRHCQEIAIALMSGEAYPMLTEEPEHCGQSIAATVAALWETRSQLALASQPDEVDAAEIERRLGES